eukprot:10330015-Lingulodinium_polyedra.AAC.1
MGLVDLAFGCQQFAMSGTRAHLGIAFYGVAEFRVLLEGSYGIVGWQISDAPGATLQADFEK